MSSKTRRSISIRGLSHQRLAKYCEDTGQSVSGYLERLIQADMAEKGRPAETVLRPKPRANTAPKVHSYKSGGVHTW